MEIIENNRKKKKQERDFFHGKTNSGWVINSIYRDVLVTCRGK